MNLDELLAAVEPVHRPSADAARQRHSRLAKPPGSLGRLEELAAQLAAITRDCPPPVPERPVVIVAAGDHGVHGQGISDWPQSVTAAMVATVASGRAAVNAIARTVGAEVVVVDVGTRSDDVPAGVVDARVAGDHGHGTADITIGPAMTPQRCLAAIAAGARAAVSAVDAGGADLLAAGDLGLGNTTASACLVAVMSGRGAHEVTGPGANVDDTKLAHKITVVEAALARHGDDSEPFAVLASLGGLEHAALVGMLLAGASRRVPIVLDGVVSVAAALVASAMAPNLVGHLVAGHRSPEPAVRFALEQLGLTPVLDLGMRLGEGTGAVLAVPIVQAAARVLAETARIDDVVS